METNQRLRRHWKRFAETGGRCTAGGRRPAERDLQQRQLLQHRHRRQGRHPDLQCRRRADAWVHGRRSDEQDHAGRHFRPAGADRARQSAERRTWNPDHTGLRGPGVQGFARDRGHLPADLHPQGWQPVRGGGVRHRAAQDVIIGYLLIGTDNTARQQAEEALLKAGALQSAIFNSANFSSIATDAKGVIQIFNVGAERMLGYTAAEVMNKITPADISDPQELIARAKGLSVELATPITPGFEALVFKASRGIEDIYELTYIRKDGSRFPAVVSVTALRDDL